MKFKHYATGEVINVERQTDKVVFSKEKDKYYRIVKDKRDRVMLHKTSFVRAGDKE